MTIARRVEAEWLDFLAPEDARAVRSRRDLARINALMLQSRIMTRSLLGFYRGQRPKFILDLGAGDATFTLRVARRLAPCWPNVTVISVDQQHIVSDATRNGFQSLGWRLEHDATEVFEFLERRTNFCADILCTNLFLHHFPREQLRLLLDRAKPVARLFVACEPRRGPIGLAAARVLWAIGCNEVSRHDALASVRGGFRGTELSSLWPAGDGWEIDERAVGPLTHRFVARRSDVEPRHRI